MVQVTSILTPAVLTSTEIPIKYLLGLLNSRLLEIYFGFIGIMTAGGAFTLKHETVIEFPIKIPRPEIEKLIIRIVELILFGKSNQTLNIYTDYFEWIINSIVYELYFPNEIKSAGCEVLKHLANPPEFKDDWNEAKKLKTIERVYKELSDPQHPVSIAMEKMKTVPEIRIIEGLE